MSEHRIHLKGPWEYRWINGGNEVTRQPESGRVKMPADWQSIFGDRAGSVRFSRRFHKPTGLEPGDTVWLLFDGIGGNAAVRLNGELLIPGANSLPGANAPALNFEITGKMNSANEIIVELQFNPGQSPGSKGGLWGPVLIVIVSAGRNDSASPENNPRPLAGEGRDEVAG